MTLIRAACDGSFSFDSCLPFLIIRPFHHPSFPTTPSPTSTLCKTMSLLRISTSSLARVSKAPTLAMAARGYADGPTEKAGATASSQGWNKREQVSSTTT